MVVVVVIVVVVFAITVRKHHGVTWKAQPLNVGTDVCLTYQCSCRMVAMDLFNTKLSPYSC